MRHRGPQIKEKAALAPHSAGIVGGMRSNRYYAGPVSDHFDGTRFFLPGAPFHKSRRSLLRFQFATTFADWPERVVDPPASPPPIRTAGTALRVTSIGHATHLIQTAGVNLLVDPVWSERASPFAFAGPKRVRPPGVALGSLPPLDAILVTHNHYDHMDLRTIGEIARTHACRIIVPLGNDTILRRHDADLRAEAYDWGERVALRGDIHVTLVPSRHWSARWTGDRCMALWAAFLFETPGGSIYHVGDTGYGDGAIFRDIEARYGPPRLAILPIGAYEPRWFMRDQHVDPDEAVRIFEACGARFALAHHWGTFRLTAEAIDEPPQRLAKALATAGIDPTRFRVQRPGESFDVPEDRSSDALHP